MTVLYATDEQGLWSYELSRAVLKKAIPDARVILFTDFDGSSEDATVVNVSRYLRDNGIFEAWNGRSYRFPPMSAARLMAPLVPETRDLDRILYLDTDTLVLKGEELRDFCGSGFDEEADCIGCRDDVQPLFLSRDNRRLIKLMNSVQETGAIEGNDGHLISNIMHGTYVNTGVILYNMARLVENGYGRTLDSVRSVLRLHRFKFVDQDLTNMLLTVQSAHTKFNDLVAGHGFVPYDDTVVAHYAGGRRAKEAFRLAAETLLAK